ncbi:MAG: hypothetical protein ACYDHP_01540 [Ferrimicrobium sp.]
MAWPWRRGRGVRGADGRVTSEAVFASRYAPERLRVGRVSRFDSHTGLGWVVLDDDPHDPVLFHCIVIDDGSRQVAVGEEVVIRVTVTLAGRREASVVHKVTPSPPLRTGDLGT